VEQSLQNLLGLLKLSGRLLMVMDGLWFLAVEKELGYSNAVRLDGVVWRKYVHSLVKTVKGMFCLQQGIEGLREIIEVDPLNLNLTYEITEFSSRRMILTVTQCAALEAMERMGRKELVCGTTTGLYFRNLAREVDPRIVVEALKLPPRDGEKECCKWRFRIPDHADE